MNIEVSTNWKIVLIVLIVWELAWKAIALWRAVRNDQRGWFVAMLIINSVGVLPIIYLLTHPQAEKPQTSASAAS